ncbi:hypothetical protein FGIG_03325, partial [Fasciola gigantica]
SEAPKHSGCANLRPTNEVNNLRKADGKQRFTLLMTYDPLDSEQGPVLTSAIGDKVGRYIRLVMPRFIRKQVTSDINSFGAHSKWAFRKTAPSVLIVGTWATLYLTY